MSKGTIVNGPYHARNRELAGKVFEQAPTSRLDPPDPTSRDVWPSLEELINAVEMTNKAFQELHSHLDPLLSPEPSGAPEHTSAPAACSLSGRLQSLIADVLNLRESIERTTHRIQL